MENERSGYAVIAAMLGIDVNVLRAVASEWEADPAKPPLGMVRFIERLQSAGTIAEHLNNTNLWEEAIRNAMEPTDIPLTLPTAGVPRLVCHPGGKKETDE